MVKNFVNIMKETPKADFVVSEANGKYSFSLVYNKNGKRLTVSKALAEKLELKDSMYLCPLFEHGVILIAKDLPKDKAWLLKLNSDDKKISYSAEAVGTLVNGFTLDYTNISSKSFTNVSFEDNDNGVVAVVKIKDNSPQENKKTEG